METDTPGEYNAINTEDNTNSESDKLIIKKTMVVRNLRLNLSTPSSLYPWQMDNLQNKQTHSHPPQSTVK